MEVFQFLADRRQAFLDRWADGQEMNMVEQGYAVALTDFMKLEYDDIEAFYAEPEEGSAEIEAKDETEDAE